MSSKVVLRALLLACVALAASAPAGAAPQAGTSSTYSDPTGDANGAPDITEASVSNDASGAITLRIAVPNRAQLGAEELIGVWIDADDNELTGYEYRVLKFQFGAFIDRWNGSAWQNMTPPASLALTWQGAQLTLTFNRADLGVVDGFGFSAAGALLAGDDPDAWPWDDAPDNGQWSYALVFAPTLGPAKLRPASPKAGGLVTVAVPVAAAGKPVDAGTVRCKATVGGKQLRAAAAGLNAGTAGCSFRLPRTAKGKTLRGAVTVTTAGGTATRAFSARVR